MDSVKHNRHVIKSSGGTFCLIRVVRTNDQNRRHVQRNRSAALTSPARRLHTFTDVGHERRKSHLCASTSELPLCRTLRPPLVVPDEEDNRILFGAVSMSFLWSMGSFIVLSLLPVYLRENLGLTNTKIGALEGLAVITSALVKGFSGILSDIIGSRKLVLLMGALLTALVKPFFALSSLILISFGPKVALISVSVGKILDRVGKGMRAAPFDALISDVSPPEMRGRAYGLNYSSSTLGAVFGCIVASTMMKYTGNNYSISLTLAVIPSVLAAVVLLSQIEKKSPILKVKSHNFTQNAETRESTLHKLKVQLKSLRKLPLAFWQALLIVCVLYLARFSESFMAIRARSAGMSISNLPLLLIIDQLMQSTLTYPMGALADHVGRKYLLLIGFSLLILANLIFMMSSSVVGMIVGNFIVGLHMSLTQSNLKALISTTIPANMRGTAFSMVGLATGTCLFVGNIMAGQLMDITISHGYGHVGAFIWGMVTTCLATFALIFLTFLDVNYSGNKMLNNA